MSLTTSETNLRSKVEHAGAACMETAKDLASSAMNQAQDAASSVAKTVGDAGATVGKKAKAATAAVGEGMESLAGNIRQNLPREGPLGSASASVAESLESGGRFLQQKGLGGVADEITDLVRRNPVTTLLVGVGLGFLLAKATARGSSHDK